VVGYLKTGQLYFSAESSLTLRTSEACSLYDVICMGAYVYTDHLSCPVFASTSGNNILNCPFLRDALYSFVVLSIQLYTVFL
jgi:hypothetical protein